MAYLPSITESSGWARGADIAPSETAYIPRSFSLLTPSFLQAAPHGRGWGSWALAPNELPASGAPASRLLGAGDGVRARRAVAALTQRIARTPTLQAHHIEAAGRHRAAVTDARPVAI